MSFDMSQFYQVFFEEAEEHLAEMERLLLALDVADPAADDLNAIFRAAHSIKGGSGTFGFNDMADLTHVLESLLDRARQGQMGLTDPMIDVFLLAKDGLRSQLAGHRDATPVDDALVARAQEQLVALLKAPEAMSTPVAAPSAPAASVARATVRRIVRLDGHCSEEGFATLVAELKRDGAVVESHHGTGSGRVVLDTSLSADDIIDVCAHVVPVDAIQVTDGAAAGTGAAATPTDGEGYGFFDDAPGLVAAESAAAPAAGDGYGFFSDAPGAPDAAAPAPDAGFGFFADAPGAPAPAAGSPAASAPTAQAAPARPVARAMEPKREPAGGAAAAAESSTIRVGVDKVDHMINLVGELVITHAMLAQSAADLDPVVFERLLTGLSQLERNTRGLQESVMSIRMLPIAVVFSRFPRMVRELAQQLDKQVDLQTVGESTELDKGLIERIADPLTHLVRNSLDHGIESPAARVAAGKPARGSITLRAFHQGGNIVIEVADDGAGLNRARILAKAKERGLAGVHDGMTDQEVWNLIFEAGFSTAEQVTALSGRGVGMDVVRRNILAMGGRVEIDSSPGLGTRMSIRLPLTLAILDGMSIAVGDEIFIVPLSSVLESLQPEPSDLKTVAGKGRVVHVRGEYLPVIAMRDVFGIPGRGVGEGGIMLILEADGAKTALWVDELVGQHQVVIKSLESNYRRVPGVSGATILGDGRVALIVDVASMVRLGQGKYPMAA